MCVCLSQDLQAREVVVSLLIHAANMLLNLSQGKGTDTKCLQLK